MENKDDLNAKSIVTLLTLSLHVNLPNYTIDKQTYKPTKLEGQAFFFDIVEVSKGFFLSYIFSFIF